MLGTATFLDLINSKSIKFSSIIGVELFEIVESLGSDIEEGTIVFLVRFSRCLINPKQTVELGFQGQVEVVLLPAYRVDSSTDHKEVEKLHSAESTLLID